MTVHTKVDNYFLRAADLIRERGHTQGKFVDRSTGALCLAESIGIAKYGDSDGFSFRKLTAEDIAPLSGIIAPYINPLYENMGQPHLGPICTWNNVEGRTPDEVIAVLETAAKRMN